MGISIGIWCVLITLTNHGSFGLEITSQRNRLADPCEQITCSTSSWDSSCCSSGRKLPWNTQPLANFRFGSIFRNAIPPKRDYTPPSFEDIFEKSFQKEDTDNSNDNIEYVIEQTTKNPSNMFDLFSRFPETHRNSESTTSSYFPKQIQNIHQLNKKMLFGDTPKISTTQRTTQRTTLSVSKNKFKEEQYLRAQQKLLQLQRKQAGRIKAKQTQSKLMQMVLAKQKELEEKRRKREEEKKIRRKEEEIKIRRQEEKRKEAGQAMKKNNLQIKYQTHFKMKNYELIEKRRREEERRRQEDEQRRQEEKRRIKEEDDRRRKQEEKRQQEEEERRLLEEDKKKALEEEERRVREEKEKMRLRKEKEAIAVRKHLEEEEKRRKEERRKELEKLVRKQHEEEIRRRQEEEEEEKRRKIDFWRKKHQQVSLSTGQQFIDKSTETKIIGSRRKDEGEDENEDISTKDLPWPEKRRDEENELENVLIKDDLVKEDRIGDPFTTKICETLVVPCRFVTEHPCCKLPQKIDLMGRPRAMDGSADLRWRFMQSRARHAEGRMIEGFGASRGTTMTKPGTSSFSVKSRLSSIPYSHWTSKEVVSVPKYHYNGGPSVTTMILRQCWRLTYLDCSREREHPCCSLHSSSQTSSNSVLASNMLDKWLKRN